MTPTRCWSSACRSSRRYVPRKSAPGGNLARPPNERLLLKGKRRVGETLLETAVRSSAVIVIVALVLIFVFVAKEALPLLSSSHVHEEVRLWSMLRPLESGDFAWQPVSEKPKYSLPPLMIGTLKVTVVALVMAIPLAILAAIFTSEFAPQQLRELIKPVVELLAGIPSVVIGFFALMVVATWVQDALGLTFRLNAITAGMGLSLAVIPIVFTV